MMEEQRAQADTLPGSVQRLQIVVSPAPADRGQPSVFEPGLFTSAFLVVFDSLETVTWLLLGTSVSFSSNSLRCDPPVLEDELFEVGFENQASP